MDLVVLERLEPSKQQKNKCIEIIEEFQKLILLFTKLRNEEIGCPKPSMRNKGPSLDFIEFFGKSDASLIEIIVPLYQKGLSISDIVNQTGFKRHTIWKQLKTHQKELRPQGTVSFKVWKKARGKMSASPPYGFCYFEGEVIKDPKEYPVLQLIQNLRKQGMSISSIMLRLHDRGAKSRTGKSWSYNVIKAIIQRTEDGSLRNLIPAKKESKNKK